METIHLLIQGMDCRGCATGIQMATESLEGVSSVFIDLDGKRGTWIVDSSIVDAEAVIERISTLGYTATVL